MPDLVSLFLPCLCSFFVLEKCNKHTPRFPGVLFWCCCACLLEVYYSFRQGQNLGKGKSDENVVLLAGHAGVPPGAVDLVLLLLCYMANGVSFWWCSSVRRRCLLFIVRTNNSISPLADLWFARPLVLRRFRPYARSLCVFEDVQSLPCSHRFCRECIMGCFKSSKRQECPLCKVSGDFLRNYLGGK